MGLEWDGCNVGVWGGSDGGGGLREGWGGGEGGGRLSRGGGWGWCLRWWWWQIEVGVVVGEVVVVGLPVGDGLVSAVVIGLHN